MGSEVVRLRMKPEGSVDVLSEDAAPEPEQEQTYTREQIDAILGAAARAQAERSGTQVSGGLSREKALSMAHELAEALDLDHELVERSFEAHEEDVQRRRTLLQQLDIQVNPKGIARRLTREIRGSLARLGYDEVVVRAVESKHVIDPKRHEEMEMLRTIVSTATLVPFSNRAGTVPSVKVVAYTERKTWQRLFGIIPYYGKVYEKFATLEVVPLEGKSVIMGVVHHDAMLEVLAPILDKLQDDLQEVTIGKLEVDCATML